VLINCLLLAIKNNEAEENDNEAEEIADRLIEKL
jgi:hypothetical protein